MPTRRSMDLSSNSMGNIMGKYLITEDIGRVYFGHPGPTYKTKYESQGIKEIEKKFPNYKVINPNQPGIESLYKKIGFDVFFNLIDKCVFGVFMTALDGRWGIGIYEEAYYMHKSGKKVYELNPNTWEFKLVKDPTKTKYYALGLTKKGEVKRRKP